MAIERKLHSKDYSRTILIGFVRKTEIFDHISLAENIQKLNPKIQELGLIVFDEIKSTNISVSYSFSQYYRKLKRISDHIIEAQNLKRMII